MYDPKSIQAHSKESMPIPFRGLALYGAIISGNAGAGVFPVSVFRAIFGRYGVM
jgi:hypothetical protein